MRRGPYPGAARAVLLGALLVALTAVPSYLAAQDAPRPFGLDLGAEGEHDLFGTEPLLHGDGRYIVIHLRENRLYLFEGPRVIWTAPVATGTGFRLEGGGREWQFDTPRGVFRIQHMEKDPVWIKPDWAFVEAGQPIPPLNSPLRRDPGMLGTTALYIGYELALHGTSRPDLVLHPDPEERRVSHGCIRLTNQDARTLYHLVEIGTPVLIY